MTINIEKMNFASFKTRTIAQENYIDGIVLLGCGGDLQEWIAGVSNILVENGIADTSNPEILFTSFVELNTFGGRTDLALLFNHKVSFNMGKMAIWRLAFGDCCWVSDYFDNYANQHGINDDRENESEWEDDFYDTEDLENEDK